MFIGMTMMSGAMTPLRDDRFHQYDDEIYEPVLPVMVGVIFGAHSVIIGFGWHITVTSSHGLISTQRHLRLVRTEHWYVRDSGIGINRNKSQCEASGDDSSVI